jgi:hypothetical protein
MKDNSTLELIIPMPTSALEVFQGGKIDPLISAIEREVRKHQPNVKTAKGRSEIASLAHKVARSKTYLDGLGKDLVADWKKKASVVDAERKRVRERLDCLKDEVRAPLTQWEEREKERIATIKLRIEQFACNDEDQELNSEQLEKKINTLKSEIIDESFEEFANEAAIAKDRALMRLEAKLKDQLQREEEQAELERLRKQEQDRLEKEAEESRKREEQERLEREKAERERAVKEAKEKAEREAAEREARLKEENARLEREAKEREQRMKEEAKRREEEAIRRERERAEEKRRQEEAEKKRREENKRIRSITKKQAVSALIDAGLTAESADIAFEAIAAGNVPKMSVNY